ncbi:magnesium/cobalt transporter CorA [Maridesulfovibrio sp.]|uniref:magnesium/cobalt transporter CorA n=1 Tax=Maridesulfovibrio sp. TaxID=2795000 RepID=UPI0029CA420C|nr:magnesium/cobalt transporter CorA [Maridesulfovibrio sp.]
MARFLRDKEQKAGLPPGSLVFTGQHKISEPKIRIIEYNSSDLQETSLDPLESIPYCPYPAKAVWMNLDGVHDSELIKRIGDRFNISPMALEDILDTGQRPFIEEYQNYLFSTLKIFISGTSEQKIFSEQVCFVLGKNYLITFQEQPGPTFDAVLKRLSKAKSKIRQNNTDYLFYTLMDCVLENYLKVIEIIGERIEDLEEEVTTDPCPEHLESINFYRREIAYIRKSIRPVREIIMKMNKLNSEFISEDTLGYMKDLPNMIDQALDSLEIYKDILGDLFTTYNMYMGTRLNETMKFLTIFSTIFIPLTFIAGLYGMNFEVIPGLHNPHGFAISIGIMAAISGVMLILFKFKKWL